MLTQSYLILSPNKPTDIASAIMTQRQSVPLAWALAVASPNATFTHEGGEYYFSTRIGDALAILDRALAAWNYNSYFRDTLAPIGVFRSWLANNPSDTWLYLNVSSLIKRSATPTKDIMALQQLSEVVNIVIYEAESKNFSQFIAELRRLSYPFITVPITGDRRVDARILSFEMRDTESPESEMALQLVGVDRDHTLLERASQAVRLRKGGHTTAEEFDNTPEPMPEEIEEEDEDEVEAELMKQTGVRLFTTDLDLARNLFVDELGFSLLRDAQNHVVLASKGQEFMLVKVPSNQGGERSGQ